MPPTVSVVMGVYNDEPHLEAAIESILDQTYRDFEFIIVDDASTDGSKALLEVDDPRVTVLDNDENVGLTRSLNRAMQTASGEFIARQDADDRSHPERLERQLALLSRRPDVAVVGTGCTLIDGSGSIRDRRVVLAEPTVDDLRRKNRLVHGSVVMRRDVIESVGGYDERFRQVQDYDLWLRISAEHVIRNLPEPLYSLRIHPDSVYAESLETSLLYELIARRLAFGQDGDELLEQLNQRGPTAVVDKLSRAERRQFHTAAAIGLLRYDRRAEAREHVLQCRRLPSIDIRCICLQALTNVPTPVSKSFIWVFRRWLNSKIRLRNRLLRS